MHKTNTLTKIEAEFWFSLFGPIFWFFYPILAQNGVKQSKNGAEKWKSKFRLYFSQSICVVHLLKKKLGL